MPLLTKDNVTDYYDVKNIKNEENIVVRVGVKKSSNNDPAHPPFIVCKEGTGANEDCKATLLLQILAYPLQKQSN